MRGTGDLDAILQCEQFLLVDERDKFANTPAMVSSLDSALVEIADAARMLPVVRNAEEYAVVDRTHRFRSHRAGDLPRDDARMFFAAHGARLLNLEKARGTNAEKAVLDQRRKNIPMAERLYTGLQREALVLR